jgi:tripartite ATP-independent transporter DctP family solute receptor
MKILIATLKDSLRYTGLGVVGLIAAAAMPAGAAEFNLKFNAPSPDGGVHGAGMHAFKQCVESRSDGRVEVKLFFSGALGAQVDGIEAMQAGTLDMMAIDTPITTIDKLLSVFGLPYIFRDREHVDTVMNGGIGDWVRERLVARGVRPLGYWEGGFRHITNNVRPISKPEDLKGIKMRTPSSKIRMKIFNTYGANASALPFPEVYSALQMGVYDAQENPAEVVATSKFYEVQKYLSFTSHVYTVSYPLMSEAVYSKLPWEIQVLMNQCGREAGGVTVDFSIKTDNDIAALVKKHGMQVNNADTEAFVAASRPIWDELAAEMGGEARTLIGLVSEAGK